MYERLKNLLSPIFILCLVLLILNDFFLKATVHNAFTGKLSDFCGLFIFPIFWTALFPKQKLAVFCLTAALFVFWKSDYASGFIELLNNVLKVQRTVDPTDLLALTVLLPGWFYTSGAWHLTINNTLLARLSAAFISAVTIFSFCATSQQRYVQSFDQPQYVLLQGAVIPDSSLYEEYDFFKQGSLLVVKVNQLYIAKPSRDDDYNKNRSIKGLDRDVVARIGGDVSLMPRGKITILAINTSEGKDSLRFNGGRLDGKFSRTKNGRVVIEGFYKMGLEDSTWTITDSSGTDILVQNFINGERTSVKHFVHKKLLSSGHINTRAEAIRNKYIQIVILILFTVGMIVLLIRNYLKKSSEQLKLARGWKWLLCFIMPVFIWLVHTGIRILLMDFSNDIFGTIASMIFVYIATCPLMFIVVFWIKLKKEIDIVLYCLLFGALCGIWTSCETLIALHN